MKKSMWIVMAMMVVALVATAPALAEMKGDMKGMDHSAMKGALIHESTVEGHKLAYHLIDNMARMEKMKDMKGMKMEGHDMGQMKSHHMMVYVMGADGAMISDAKVGFLVEGPGGEQKTMAMFMTDGFGSDLELKGKGSYTIKTKIKAGETSLKDSFTYESK